MPVDERPRASTGREGEWNAEAIAYTDVSQFARGSQRMSLWSSRLLDIEHMFPYTGSMPSQDP